MSIRLMFEWRDLWVGVFIDTSRQRAYILPIPCCGIVLDWSKTASGCIPASDADRGGATRC